MANFRGIAAIVAQSQLSNGSPKVWAMLVDQLSCTLRVIADAHVVEAKPRSPRHSSIVCRASSLSFTSGSRRPQLGISYLKNAHSRAAWHRRVRIPHAIRGITVGGGQVKVVASGAEHCSTEERCTTSWMCASPFHRRGLD